VSAHTVKDQRPHDQGHDYDFRGALLLFYPLLGRARSRQDRGRARSADIFGMLRADVPIAVKNQKR